MDSRWQNAVASRLVARFVFRVKAREAEELKARRLRFAPVCARTQIPTNQERDDAKERRPATPE